MLTITIENELGHSVEFTAESASEPWLDHNQIVAEDLQVSLDALYAECHG
jgi:hypothetical protein